MADAEYRLAQAVDAVLHRSTAIAGTHVLRCARRYRVLAWPNYASPSDLRSLFQGYGRLLTGQPDVSLCLVHVEGRDPGLQDAIDMARRFREEALGPGIDDGIEFVDGSRSPDGWPELGSEAHAVIALPSGRRGPRRAFERMIGVPSVTHADDLRLILNGVRVRDRANAWRLPAAPARPGDPTLAVHSTPMHHPEDVWRGLGYSADQFGGELIVDIGCGPCLRTSWFASARIEAVEPRASVFAEYLLWSDLGRASMVHETALTTPVTALRGRARLVMVDAGGAADRRGAIEEVATRYLADDGALVLRVPRGTPGPRGLVAVREWAPRGADPRVPFSVWRRA